MFNRIVGIDEVGRGPLAGPVTVCAFSVKESFDMSFLRGVTDSKKMTKKAREEWSEKLHKARRRGKVEFATCSVSAREIDKKGISAAIRTAIRRALTRLNVNPKKSSVFLDGSLKAPERFVRQKTIIGGDGKHKLISAASVIAKVHRDAYVTRLGKRYPKYGFEVHKGYGTLAHRKSIQKEGRCPEHRESFCRNI